MILTRAEMAAMRKTIPVVALSMTCSIERFTSTGEDAFGQPTGVWGVLADDVPCFYWEQAEREVIGQRINAVFAGAHVQMEARTDVHAGDRIRNVIAQDGFALGSLLNITSVLQRETVTVLDVEEVT
jgi:hypothetical protein